ncbi:MAG: AMP-binding protein [Treponemataceae bacterium]|nr:AMP-binding protein [Treponemataceae bacterium]
MKRFLKVLFYVVAALYPALVFTLLVLLKLNVRILSLCVIVLAGAFFISATGGRNSGGEKRKSALDWRPMVSSALFLAAGIFCFLTDNAVFLKLYSVVISLTLLFLFGSTLLFPPNICFRFAVMMDKSISGSSFEGKVLRYTKKVTAVWCAFFVINGSIAAYTALHDFGSEELNNAVWSVYNGGISYVLMGLLFAVEFVVRRRVDKKMMKCFSFTKFKADSRRDDFVLCYENVWSDKAYKTWKDFLTDTAKLRAYISAAPEKDWILHCEDYWYFLAAFVALLQCRRRILLTQNISAAFISEIKADGAAFLTDQAGIDGAADVAAVLAAAPVPSEAELRAVPEIDADSTQILMYTSGSTGRPKAVLQRMTEFEADNAFVISQWEAEFAGRKLVTTVSQHHIYGFLFGMSLPFTLGVPFRRTRITYPEEFERLSDESYVIVATPAFLKRTVEIEERLPLRNPWIFTSGGACSPELAAKTEAVFGFCPLEVYGSTETSGIAYRQQSVDGLKYTPFANAKVWLGDDGCLRIISPYIKDPEGFATADLAELLPDGRFLLKGRSDSIVKIEEKRISMTEVENRLLESGLVADVKVVALSNDVRQYLAAAVVLNGAGRAQFAGQEKYRINRWFHDFLLQWFENVVVPKRWRYLDALPADAQGKKHRLEIEALFSAPENA